MHIYCFYTVFFEWKEKDSHGGRQKAPRCFDKINIAKCRNVQNVFKKASKGRGKTVFFVCMEVLKEQRKTG